VKVNLPIPPNNLFYKNLIATLKGTFLKIRPASGWRDKEAPLNAARVTGANQPTWAAFRDSIYAWKFSATGTNECWITFHMPHDLMLSYTDTDGTITSPKLYPHVHYASIAATPSTGAVRWGFEWTYAHGYGSGTFGASSTIYLEHSPAGVQYQHEIAEVTDANALTDNFEVDGLLLMRFFRDGGHANDTNTDDLFVFTIDMHYLCDGLQTVERNRGSGSIPWTKQNSLG